MKPLRTPQYVALDRDGTVLRYVPYLARLEDVHLVSSAGPAIARLNQAGVRVILVTNQSVVSKGQLSLSDLDMIHGKMIQLLKEQGARLDDILVCPHAPEDQCQCRKPLPELLARYLEREGLDPRNGFVVGDNTTDMELAFNIGATPVHVKGGVHTELDIAARYAEVLSTSDIGTAIASILGKRNDG